MNILQMIHECQEKTKLLDTMIPIKQHEARLAEIDEAISTGNVWNNPQHAAGLMKERQKLSDLIETLARIKGQTTEFSEFIEVFPSEIDSLTNTVASFYQEIEDFELEQMFTDPVDDSAAILSISAGAGGLEAANWVTMLFRMYSRYADSYKFIVELLDHKPSEEHGSICTDNVSIRIEGPYAYGFFKGEAGVHRLIRNSPFNSGDARHTSFAAVAVVPDIEDTIDIKIEEKDLDITCQTAGGPGGQNVNKVASAVRLKHIPSGINILVRTERDQGANRKTAMKMLKAKLYDIELKKLNAEKDKLLAQQSDAAFGHQIRTTTMTPYSLVKDHRTDVEINNAEAVLDGDIHKFIIASLRANTKF